jgi:hypothetical protein
MLIHRDLHDAPWANQEKLTFWFRTLGGDSYFAQGQIHWANVIAHLLSDVSCRTCPIAQLPTNPTANRPGPGEWRTAGDALPQWQPHY